MKMKDVLFCLTTAAAMLLHGAESEFKFDFEQGNGKQLPAGSVQVKGKDEGGFIEIIKDPVAGFTKAIKMTADPKKPDVRLLIQKKFSAETGEILHYEAMVKGNGRATFGLYGFNKAGSMIEYDVAGDKINSKTWVKLSKDIPLRKKGIIYIWPFLQCNGGEIVFSGLKVTLRGIPNGRWEHRQGASDLSWKKQRDAGSLKQAEKKATTFVLNLNATQGPCIIAAEKFSAKSGDLISVSFKAKGKGLLSPAITLSDKSGQNSLSTAKAFPLTAQWQKYSCDIRVTNTTSFETTAIQPAFQLAANGNAQIDDISIFWQSSKFTGDLAFPKQATVFPLMDAKFQPTAAQLTSIPTTLNGVRAVKAEVNAAVLDLATLMNGVKLRNCAWVYFKLNSPIECNYTIGAGADWWMTVYCNGKKIIDTMATGNSSNNCDVTDHAADVRLKKGENIIAVKFLSGKASSILQIGGPAEIRKYNDILVRSRELAIDNYQDKSVLRPGSPSFIEVIARGGEMTKTLAGVYSKNTKLTPFKKSFSLKKLQSGEMLGQSILLINFPFSDKGTNQFIFSFSSGKKAVQCVMENADANSLLCYFSVNGKRISAKFKVPNAKKILPLEATMYCEADGHCIAIFGSTKNTGVHYAYHCDIPQFRAMADKPLTAGAEIRLAGNAKMTVDDYTVVSGKVKIERSRMPFLLDLSPEFDPVKAGWKLMISDEFNGTKVDEQKWIIAPRIRHLVNLDGKGHLVLTTDWNKEHTKLEAGGVRSQRVFTYGYFEARLRFTKELGSWSSFWMMSPWTPVSPFHSVEFDFYEDYYTRPRGPGMPYGKTLDSTAYAGWRNGFKRPVKIWNYQSEVPGSLDEFYTFGAKWTPFEISYYLNGKQIRGSLKFSPYQTVTWDAFNHCAVACQTRMNLTNQTGMGDPKHGKYPEYFVVDYFRAYEYPKENLPQIKWIGETQKNLFVSKGATLNFRVDAKPGASGAKIRGVYLFDNGYYIAKKEEPPYTFNIPMTEEYFKTTQYMVPGVSKGTVMTPPPFDTPFPHTFKVFVQDENGKINWTDVRKFILKPAKDSTPYQGKAAVIPGTLQMNLFDAGGQGVAYYWSSPGGRDQTFRKEDKVYATNTLIESNDPCNWAKYTVDVKKTGKYDAELSYLCAVSGADADCNVEMYVDGVFAGRYKLYNAGTYSTPQNKATLRGIHLPAGRHQILLMFTMQGFCSKVNFTESR